MSLSFAPSLRVQDLSWPAWPLPDAQLSAREDGLLMLESFDTPDKPSPVLPRIARGDAAAVAECLQRYGGLVQRLARHWCGGPCDTDDIVQEIFIELWKQAARFDPALSPEVAFVAMITRRKLIDRYRRRQAVPTFEPLTEVPSREESSPVDRDDTMVKVRALLSQLPIEQRQVLVWAVCEGVTHQVIADRTQLPLGTVKTYIRRGLIFIRDHLSGDTIGGLR
jgi:RNA polymerase sigma factor (sigma-70 family)